MVQNLPGWASKNFISWKRAGSSRNEVENLRGFIERAEQNRAEARGIARANAFVYSIELGAIRSNRKRYRPVSRKL